jgi:release factor glutamine methyltransferase
MALEVSRWEPHQALDGGETGLNSIQRLLDQAHGRLFSPGVILLEIESSVGPESLKAARESFPNADCQLHQDLAGHDRIIEILQP